MPEVAILVKAKDEASATLGKVGGSLGKLGKVAAGVGLVGAAALGGIAVGAAKLALDAAKLEPTKVTFDNLSKSIGSTADAMLKKLRPAAMGVVSDADLMQAANKLMAMGLAETEDEAAKLTEMATTLGMAMGEDATTSMENFALMMANQSIPRLDSFGISSGKVRERIAELMEETEGLTREQAFNQAVMEQGAEAMERVGDIGGTSAVTMAQFGVTMDNLKMTVGEALLPVLKGFLDTVLIPLAQKFQEFIPIIQEKLTPIMERLATDVAPKVSGALGTIGSFIAETLVPAIMTLVKWIGENVIPVIKKLAAWVMDTLIPAIKKLFGWIADNLVPIFKEFADEMAPRFQGMLETIGKFITETLVPALKDFWERTEGIRESIIAFMGSAAVSLLKTLLGELPGLWDKVGGAIARVRDAIQWLIDKIREVIDKFRDLSDKIPDWLKPGSASPLELSVRGITDAFKDLNIEMGVKPTMMPAFATGGGDQITNINLGGVYSMGGFNEAVEEAVRDAARYSL